MHSRNLQRMFDHCIGITATTAPSLASLNRIQRPSRGSLDVAATTTRFFRAGAVGPAASASCVPFLLLPAWAETAGCCDSLVGRSDGATSWIELTKPAAGIVASGEKDRSRSSIFHNRIWPSHEPEPKTSPYGRHDSAVIHRGVPMTPSVSETCSLIP